MTDLDININLARAMGWVEISEVEYSRLTKTGFVVASDGIICAYNFCLLDFKFDYRDPVIFVAICKHWGLVVNHHYKWVSDRGGIMRDFTSKTVEKAAALCVIDTVRRGVK